MADGFFQGGMAEGMLAAQAATLAERAQTEKTGIASRGLDIDTQRLQHAISQDNQKQGDAIIAEQMGHVTELIKQGKAVGTDPATIIKTVQPLVDSIKPVAAKIGRNPNIFDAQVHTMVAGPTGVQVGLATGAAQGAAAGQAQVTGSQVITGSPVTAPGAPGGAAPGGKPNITSIILDPKQRADMEKTMADDYRAESKNFVVVRDFHDRMLSAPKTGAGDMSLVFSYMKILDPASSVREGEYATAQNAAGIPEGIRGMLNKMIGEGKLGAGAREQIIEAGKAAWNDSVKNYNSLTQQTHEKATRYGINPKNVIIDYNPKPTKDDPLGLR